MAEKLTGLAVERTAKLADARDRYGIRVDLELVNVLLISQPKVIVPVTISNRTVSITRTVVWDPLLHRLEPLVCDVCGAPGEGLHLCTGGHLAHAACLAPQCIDCKREFCQLCAKQVSVCVVCQQPVCQASLITCPTCRRGTCHQHRELCHAANGEPAVLAPPAPPPPAPRPSPLAPPAPPPSQPAKGKKSPPAAAQSGKAKPPAKAPPPARTAPIVTGVRIEVEVYATEPTVTAFVMRSTKGILAQRVFQLTPQGLLVHCKCEKSPCPADGYYHFPAGPEAITEQVVTLLQALQHEYLIPAKKVKYYTIYGQQVHEDRQLVLPAHVA